MKKSLLVLVVCLVAPTISLPYRFNGKNSMRPVTQNQGVHARHFPLLSRRMGQNMPRIIFLKNFFELECMRGLFNRHRFRPRQGVPATPEKRGRFFRVQGQGLQRPTEKSYPQKTFNGRPVSNKRIIFMGRPPPLSMRRGSIRKTSKDATQKNPGLIPREETKVETTTEIAKQAEDNVRHPQVFPPHEEISKSLHENLRALPENVSTVNLGDEKFSRVSQRPKTIRTTTATYPQSTAYHLWRLTRPSSIRPYEVEEIIEEKVRIDLEDDKEDNLRTFDLGKGKLFRVGKGKIQVEEENSREKGAEVIGESINAILRELVTSTSNFPATATYEKNSSDTRPKWKEPEMATEQILASNDRFQNHRSVNFTVPFESIDYKKDHSAGLAKQTTDIQKNEKNSFTPSELLNIQTQYPAMSSKMVDDFSSTPREEPESFRHLIKDLPTEENQTPTLFRNITQMISVRKKEVSTPLEVQITPQWVSNSGTDPTTHVVKEYVPDDTTIQEVVETVEYFSESTLSDVEWTTPDFKEFTGDPRAFDLFTQINRKEEGNWKNSRKMHFGQDLESIISNNITRSRGSEQRRSDILITDGLQDYWDDENNLSTLRYLEKFRQNGSVWTGLDSSSLISMIPGVINDLREDRIPAEDIAILSEAFGRYWPHIVTLSNDTNLDMLPLLKMKDEKDLERILQNLHLEDTQKTTMDENESEANNTDDTPPYDYMEEYKELYRDILGEEEDDKRRRLRVKREEEDDINRAEATREYFESIEQEKNKEDNDYLYEYTLYDDLPEGDDSVFELKEGVDFHINVTNFTPRDSNKMF